MKTIFIHGYAHGIECFFRKRNTEIADFLTFSDHIRSGQGKLFYWAKQLNLSHLHALNVWRYVQLYWQERALANDPSTHLQLHEVLEREQPEQIICHSMGCYLLAKYRQNYPLPRSVKSVIFLQADCDETELLFSGLLSNSLTMINVFRHFDSSLLLSSFIHRSKRLGLKKLRHQHVQNIYFPSFKRLNPHTALLYDESLKKILSFE